ncbi:Fungal specific transcription factor domain containing protein [Hyaloscypha variabilis]
MEDVGATQPKLAKACDDCKSRKVRCTNNPNAPSCTACTKRNVPCRFSRTKKRGMSTQIRGSTPAFRPAPSLSIRDTQNSSLSTDGLGTPRDAVSSSLQQQPLGTHPSKLYIDHLLEDGNTCGRRQNEPSIIKAHDYYVGSSGLAFFSEKRISSISKHLGHTKFRDHIETLAALIGSRMNRNGPAFGSAIKFTGPTPALQVSFGTAKSYIAAYFTHVHPLYPFLDRKNFEEKAFSTEPVQHAQGSPHFSALYHAVLALGCQYQDGTTYDPAEGMAWKLYQTSLGLLSDILVPREALVDVQAVTAMAIFAQNSSCLQIGNMLTAEAARMAQLLGFNKTTCHGENGEECHRTFWVIYILEKMASFACGRASILVDYDIGAPIPKTPDAVFQDFDWFITMARFSRLLSRAYEVLFSISATLNSTEMCHAAIDIVNNDLESWRNSIPKRFRPGEPFQSEYFSEQSSMAVALRTHYHYYSVVIALSRISLHGDAGSTSQRQSKSKEALLNAARVIIELTRYIDTGDHHPVWIWGSIPLSALFILFDFVVHNPTHPDTKSNLSLLGVAAGYFCRLEYASGGSLPSSLLSDFAYIARQYVQDLESKLKAGTAGAADVDRSLGQSSIIGSAPQSPPLSVSVYNYGDETLADPLSVDTLAYPVNDIPFSDGIDLMDFFDNSMMDYRNPIEWVNPMQEVGSQLRYGL